MRFYIALLLCAFLLFGCVLPLPVQQDGKAVLPAPPAPPRPPIIGNDEPANHTVEQNKTAEPEVNDIAPEEIKDVIQEEIVNETWEDEEEPDPFAGWTPRSVSDKIGEGQFFLLDQNLSPLRVYVINDGHADSILINKGDFNMLVDAGNFAQVSAFLATKNVKRLDVLVASRDKPDAIGGMAGVLDSYEIGEFWENGVPPSSSEYKEVVEKVNDKKITVKRPQAGDALDLWGAQIAVLNPQPQRMHGSPESDAVVLKASFSGFCMLLLNPTVQERENALMNSPEDLRCDVATYYEHGGGRPTPSLLLNRADPKDVIISVGANTEGLPSETTITRLTLDGVNILRTDRDGTVLVEKRLTREYRIAAGQ